MVYMNGHYVEPEKEVLPEFSFFHHLFQISVGCRYYPGVDFSDGGSAYSYDTILLQKSKQLDLDGKRQVPNFIKEQGAAFS